MKFEYYGILSRSDIEYQGVIIDITPTPAIPSDWFTKGAVDGYLQAVWFFDKGLCLFQFGTVAGLPGSSGNERLEIQTHIQRNTCFRCKCGYDDLVCHDLFNLENNTQLGLWSMRRKDNEEIQFSLELNL